MRTPLTRFLKRAAAVLACTVGQLAFASGGTMHLYVSQLALDHYVENAELKNILQQQRGLLMSSSWYPDGGYQVDNIAPSDGHYGELSHWGGFTQAYLDHILLRRSPNDGDYAKQVATLLGIASHQLEDQLVDNSFLRLVEEADGHWQDEGDTGFDVLLLADKDPSFSPDWSWPRGDLVEAYDDMGLNTFLLNSRIGIASGLLATALVGERALLVNIGRYRDSLAWGKTTYIDGPFGAHQRAYHIAKYWEALFARLQNRTAPFVASSIPAAGGKAFSNESRSVASRLYVVFGREVDPASINQDSLKVFNQDGRRIAGRVERYGHGEQKPTLMWFQPSEDLQATEQYVLVVDANLRDGYGTRLGESYEIEFAAPIGDQQPRLPKDLAFHTAFAGHTPQDIRFKGQNCRISPAHQHWHDGAVELSFDGEFDCGDGVARYSAVANAQGFSERNCNAPEGVSTDLCRSMSAEIRQRAFAPEQRLGLQDGVAYELRPRHALDKCADVEGYSLQSGTNISQFDCHGQANQRFWAQLQLDGSAALVNVASGKCLAQQDGTRDGLNVLQADCNGSDAQAWYAERYQGPFFTLRNKQSDKVLELTGNQNAANGVNIQTWSFDGSEDMQWQLLPSNGSIAFESANFPGRFFTVSRTDAKVYNDDYQFSRSDFRVVAGLADSGCVSFESRAKPGQFLRHSGYWLWAHNNNGSAGFAADATFCMKPALNGDNAYRAYESFNFPNHFIRHSGGRLRIDAATEDALFAQDAAWKYQLR